MSEKVCPNVGWKIQQRHCHGLPSIVTQQWSVYLWRILFYIQCYCYGAILHQTNEGNQVYAIFWWVASLQCRFCTLWALIVLGF